MKEVVVVILLFMLAGLCGLAARYIYPLQPDAYPVACADIPESNQRVVIVRDGQVECHYKITKVKEKK